jgi:serine/threonine-protein kinase
VAESPLYEFGPFRLDGSRRVLWRDGEVVPLTPKALDVLVALVEQQGKVVTKSELMDKVWPDTFVEEANLTVNVSALRKALGDDDGKPFIQTLARRGYRFAAEVRRDAQPQPPTLAILPFTPLAASAGGEPDLLGVGIADAVITRLSRAGQVLVRPTSAVLRHAEGTRDAREVGRALHVEMVLDGRFQGTSDRVRVTTQLVRVSDGSSVWAATFDEGAADVFALQDNLAERLARALALSLGGRTGAASAPTRDPEAYRAYLKGRYFWHKLTGPWLEKSRAAFQEAVDRDPGYARAWSGLADSYAMLALYCLRPARQAWEMAGRAAARAVEIDDTLAEAHVSLGYVRLFLDWDWAAAENELRRALDLASASAETHHWYALFLAMSGRFPEAMAEIARAQQLDPLSLTINTGAGFQLYLRQQYEPEIEQHLRSLELDPEYAVGHWALGLAYEQKGLLDEAIAHHRKAVALSEDSLLLKSALGNAYARAGRREEAEAILTELSRPAAAFSPYRLATLFATMGEREKALECLERGCAEKDQWMVWVKVDPLLDPLRGEGRFEAVLQRVGP